VAAATTVARTATTVRTALPTTGKTSGMLVGIASALVLAGGAAMALRRRPAA
jgi:LPXTG-motif cell wall-anchored protein